MVKTEIVCRRLNCEFCIEQNCTRGKCCLTKIDISKSGCLDFQKEVKE